MAAPGARPSGVDHLAVEQKSDGLADALDDEPGQDDQRERRECREGLVRLSHEDADESPDDDARGGERAASGGPEREPDEERRAEHHNSERHAVKVGPRWEGGGGAKGARRTML